MYTQYCANQENCIRTMDLLEKKNKPFAKFLDVRRTLPPRLDRSLFFSFSSDWVSSHCYCYC